MKEGEDGEKIKCRNIGWLQESVILEKLKKKEAICLTTLGLNGGSIFFSYSRFQSIERKNGWDRISSWWGTTEGSITKSETAKKAANTKLYRKTRMNVKSQKKIFRFYKHIISNTKPQHSICTVKKCEFPHNVKIQNFSI